MEHDFVEQLGKEGRLDSHGKFTLDPGRARELLGQKLAFEPHLFALCLVAAAVAQGARTINIHCDAARFHMIHDGLALRAKDLNWLSGVELEWSTDAPYLRDLQFGLQGAWGMGPRRILVESRGDGPGCRLTMDAQTTRAEVTEHVAKGTHILIDFPKSILASKFRSLQSDISLALRERCRWIRCSLQLNGKPLGQVWKPDPCLVWRMLEGPELEEPTPDYHRAADFHLAQECALLALDGGTTGLEVVVHGVSYPYPGELEFPMGGVVYSPHLHKDLSQNRLVQDEQWHTLEEWVRSESRNLVRSLFLEWDRLDASKRAGAVPHLDKLAELESRAGNLDSAQKIYERLLVVRARLLEPTAPDLLLNLSNLATLHSLQERCDAALRIFLDIADDLQKANRPLEASTYFVRALSLENRVTSQWDAELLTALVGWAECAVAQERPMAVQVAAKAMHRLRAIEVRLPEASQLRPRLEKILQHEPLRGFGPKQGRSVCPRCLSSRTVPAEADVGSVQGQPIQATLCGSCGFLEFGVANFDQIWQQHLEAVAPAED